MDKERPKETTPTYSIPDESFRVHIEPANEESIQQEVLIQFFSLNTYLIKHEGFGGVVNAGNTGDVSCSWSSI